MSASHPGTVRNVYRNASRLTLVLWWLHSPHVLHGPKELALQSFMSTLNVCKKHLRN
jgi:hypothetical protein